ncbi:MAG: VOC family protein [Gemmatimonadota bacterium]
MRILALDHVQLAMPEGGEPAAREFYTNILGFDEVPKPAALAGRGGAWFTAGSVHFHLGVEANFRPARKAHPALLVEGLRELITRCEAAGRPVTPDIPLPGMKRINVTDPFGNRIELIERDGPASLGAE